MSSIGCMFAPHHQDVADELVRVTRPGGTIALLSWTPEGMLGHLFKTIGPFAPAPPAGAQPPPLWGSEEHLRGAVRRPRRVEHARARHARHHRLRACRATTASTSSTRYGPAIAARANAERNGRAEEFDDALDAFCDEWNLGTADQARFEKEFLVSVGTRL